MSEVDLARRLWEHEFLSRGLAPRSLPADSLFVAAIALVADGRIELAAALADVHAD